MYVLTLSEVSELKNLIKNKFNTILHFHDSCGGQIFSLDKSDENLREFIAAFFTEKKLRVIFSDDSTQFSVEELS